MAVFNGILNCTGGVGIALAAEQNTAWMGVQLLLAVARQRIYCV